MSRPAANYYQGQHSADSHCLVSPADDCCIVCGVYHGDACPCCGGRGFHADDCPDLHAPCVVCGAPAPDHDAGCMLDNDSLDTSKGA